MTHSCPPRRSSVLDQYRQQNDAARAAAQKAVQDAKDKAARDAEKRLAKIDAELGGKMAAAEADVAAARTSAMAEIESVAGEAAGERGRASCRERGCQYVSLSVVAVSRKQKK